ncbi:gamma-glutamyltransferase [Vibrio sp.]|nr:gamma-glutamyltransferase [Vibrio sp.]
MTHLIATQLTAVPFFNEDQILPVYPDATGQKYMVSATNPYVTSTGYSILSQGGNAIDAMVAMQMVMSVVEPDMTGLGGGTFALYYRKNDDKTLALDGRDQAPISATPNMFLNDEGRAVARNEILGAKSVAIPGTLRLLSEAHQKYGSMKWEELVTPAIHYAEHGYAMNSYTADIVVREQSRLIKDDEIKALYWDGDEIKPAGTPMKNPALAATLKGIAKSRDKYLYDGPLGKAIIDKVNNLLPVEHPKLSLSDFKNYQIKEREVVESQYKEKTIRSFGYPASGGLMVSQTLELLETYPIDTFKPTELEPWRLMTEAMRLSHSDRVAYAGDPDFISTDTQAMLSPDYIKERRQLIFKTGVMTGKVSAGDFGVSLETSELNDPESKDTGHISIIDSDGNAIAMTSTVGTGMGSGVMVNGLLLNAQMANFSSKPTFKGKPVANAIAAGKRPRSAMSPIMMFDKEGNLELVIGSPGSSQIPGYVLKTIVGIVDWGLTAQQAIDLPNIQYGTKIDRTKPKNPKGLLVEKRTFAEMLVPGFMELGYPVHVIPVVSGLNAIEIRDGVIHGATDRRRASTSLGH